MSSGIQRVGARRKDRTKLKRPTIKLSVASDVPGWWYFCRLLLIAPQAIPYCSHWDRSRRKDENKVRQQRRHRKGSEGLRRAGKMRSRVSIWAPTLMQPTSCAQLWSHEQTEALTP